MPIRKWKWLLLAALILLVAGWLYSIRAQTRIEAMPSPPGESNAGIQILKVSAAVDSLAWSPDSKLLAIQTKPNAKDKRISAILLWDMTENQLSRILYETSGVICSVAYSPDGRKLACGQWDSGPNGEAEVLSWDASTGKQLDSLRVAPLEGLGLPFTSDILCVIFSPDSRFIAAGTKLVDQGAVSGGHIGGEVCMWDLERGTVKWSDRQTHADMVYAAAFSPDGKTLASAGMDTLIRIFESDSGHLKQTLWGSG